MPIYFNYISQENEEIERAVEFYLLPIQDKYLFVVSPQTVEELPNGDATTRIKSFWLLSRAQVNKNIVSLFPDNTIIQRPLTREEVSELFEFDPEITVRNQFDAIHKYEESSIHKLTTLLNSSDTLEKQHATWALALLTCNEWNHDAIHNANDISLISLLKSADVLTVRYATAALAKLVRHGRNQAHGIAPLISLLTSADVLTVRYATAALANGVQQNERNCDVIREADGITLLISLLTSADVLMVRYATAALATMVINRQNCEILRNKHELISYIFLLQCDDPPTREYACRFFRGLNAVTIQLENDDSTLQSVSFNRFIHALINKILNRYQLFEKSSDQTSSHRLEKLSGAIHLITDLMAARDVLLSASPSSPGDNNKAFKRACLDAIEHAESSLIESTSKRIRFYSSEPSFSKLIHDMKQTLGSPGTGSGPTVL